MDLKVVVQLDPPPPPKPPLHTQGFIQDFSLCEHCHFGGKNLTVLWLTNTVSTTVFPRLERALLVSSELLAGFVFEGAFYSRARSI